MWKRQKKFYREKAIDLLRHAADDLKLKSRTVELVAAMGRSPIAPGRKEFIRTWAKDRTLPQGRTRALRIQINATEDQIRRNFGWCPPGD